MDREMKDSGIDIVGSIPKEWNTVKLKYLANIKTGCQDTQDATGEGIYPFYVRSPIIEKIDKYVFDGEAILMAGDGVGAGKVFHYVNEKFGCHQRVYIIHSFNNIIGKFLFYYMKNLFSVEIEKGSAKSTVDSVRLPMLYNFVISVPPINEQKKIANYLDIKCSEIENLKVDIQSQIDILEDYKKSVITEAVTKGLNSNVEMKDSGIEWIGEIPKYWTCKKMKYIISNQLTYGANESGEDFNEEFPRYIRITDIDENNSLKETGKLSLSPEIAKPYLLKDDDILFARSGATVGKTFLYQKKYGESAFAGYLIRAQINKMIALPKYIYYSTLGIGYENWKNSIFTQATIQNISADKYSVYQVPIPTISEQQEIVEYLNKKCFEIDNAIKDKKEQLDVLEQYKKSLIYEHVTGKKEAK